MSTRLQRAWTPAAAALRTEKWQAIVRFGSRAAAEQGRFESPMDASWVRFKDYISVHPSALIGPNAVVNILNPPDPPCCLLEIGEDSQIFSTFGFLRPQARIRVGARCQLGASQFIAADTIHVEDDVFMAWNVTVLDSDTHSLYWSDRQHDISRCREAYEATAGRDIARNHDWASIAGGPVTIGRKSWIGFNSIILKSVTIGEGAIVGAGSVVRRDVKPWHVAYGNPAREIRGIPKERGAEERRAAFGEFDGMPGDRV